MPRSRLRKRKNNPYRLGLYRFSKYYFHTANRKGSYDKDRILESGFTIGETWGCLEKAWVGFRAAKRLENDKDIKLYASVIQRLEKELKIKVNDFLELASGDFENEQEDDVSKLAVIDPLTNEKIKEAKEDQDYYVEVDLEGNIVSKSQEKEDKHYFLN